jgi:hypothetical protein
MTNSGAYPADFQAPKSLDGWGTQQCVAGTCAGRPLRGASFNDDNPSAIDQRERHLRTVCSVQPTARAIAAFLMA